MLLCLFIIIICCRYPDMTAAKREITACCLNGTMRTFVVVDSSGTLSTHNYANGARLKS